MNVTSYIPEISSQFSPSTVPSVLWRYYILYLWDYQPNSWVARTAYTCRFLAIIVSLPIIVLALLDISSYGIARTLGVIDDVKASTSDIPVIQIDKSSTSQSESPCNHSRLESTTSTDDNIIPLDRYSQSQTLHLGISQPQTFYASEDNNLRLSGVGVFSPAASRPASPTISRRNLQLEGKGISQETDEGLQIRQRVKQMVSLQE
ncbi:hypothetical protein BDZ94DRAFT_1279049 [Collybia nuda]|uniref:Uncharacterized protein n=1 Tax=Collybia nuda TaxID=64659 RepID=A0A9P5YII5_9AGAR|nr:hypothetical protein BDZ94DRAFT_1279049 [Collybia nuda]